MGDDLQDGGHRGVSGAVLCALADIDDPGGKGFVLADGRRIFVIRRGRGVWGYANACPHQGVPLDWRPDVFLSLDKSVIQCSTHGAQFRIEDGECLAGPCLGAALRPVPVALADGMVVAS